MNKYERLAHTALIRRLRSMIPGEEDFPIAKIDNPHEWKIVAGYFEGLTTKIADQLQRKAER